MTSTSDILIAPVICDLNFTMFVLFHLVCKASCAFDKTWFLSRSLLAVITFEESAGVKEDASEYISALEFSHCSLTSRSVGM